MPIPGSPTETIKCLTCEDNRRADGRSADARLFHQPGATALALFTTGGAGSGAYESDAVRKSIMDTVFDAGHSVCAIEWDVDGEFGGVLFDMGGRGYRRSYGFGWRAALMTIRRALVPHFGAVVPRIVAAGNSGGALQFLYAMQTWHVDPMLTGVVVSGGPPTYLLGFPNCIGGTRTDYLMGWTTGTCSPTVPTWTPEQEAAYRLELLQHGRHDFACPIHIVNSEDETTDPKSGNGFSNVVNVAGGRATHELIAGSAHDVDQQVAGAAAISAALLGFLG